MRKFNLKANVELGKILPNVFNLNDDKTFETYFADVYFYNLNEILKTLWLCCGNV